LADFGVRLCPAAAGERRHLPGLVLAVAVAALFYLPNLWWNWSHGFATYLHVRDNAALRGALIHPENWPNS